MSENIEYIVNEKGEKIKAIISLPLLNKILSREKSGSPKMTREKIKKFEGTLKLNVDPLEFQKVLRNEWQ